MTHYEPGDVILVPFPFTDFATLKRRPALIISNKHYNNTFNDIIIVTITSYNPYDLSETNISCHRMIKSQQACPNFQRSKLVKLFRSIKSLLLKRLAKYRKFH